MRPASGVPRPDLSATLGKVWGSCWSCWWPELAARSSGATAMAGALQGPGWQTWLANRTDPSLPARTDSATAITQPALVVSCDANASQPHSVSALGISVAPLLRSAAGEPFACEYPLPTQTVSQVRPSWCHSPTHLLWSGLAFNL